MGTLRYTKIITIKTTVSLFAGPAHLKMSDESTLYFETEWYCVTMASI